MHRTLSALAVLAVVLTIPLGAATAAVAADTITVEQCEYGGGHLDFDSHNNTICVGGESNGSRVDW
ncbi:hypothetical protein G3I19_06160 [Streptomyces sp. SID10853]|uniref:hypothetical protein n=1 Tax=Streptomyces sp. SID10853 TaxID=2706028 RepID=UPI0013C21BA0|nr:hypothetical protein [Streptomyces sp. SID10853]NDZ78114.1 hypothetical protein [Streptomyces sp. SID10853]